MFKRELAKRADSKIVDVKLYKKTLFVSFPKSITSRLHISLSDSYGREVTSIYTDSTSKTFRINIDNFIDRGVYICKIIGSKFYKVKLLRVR